MHLSEATIAWLLETGEGILHDFIKHVTDLSRLAAAVDSARALDQDACQSLLCDSLKIEMDHKEIYKKIHEGIDGGPPIYASGELKAALPATDRLFGPPYQFRSIGEANRYIFLWSSISCVYPLIC
jgi:hypothetical protein